MLLHKSENTYNNRVNSDFPKLHSEAAQLWEAGYAKRYANEDRKQCQ